MSNINKQAVQAVADLKAGYTIGHADVAILNELARIALASLEAEPVAWLLSGGGAKNNVSFDSGNAYADPLREVTPLYTAPPAPVSVPDAIHSQGEKSASDDYYALGWNACRAAMIQAGNHTEQHLDMVVHSGDANEQLEHDRKPELAVWYGAMPETNGKTNWTAILHRKGQHVWEGITIDRSEYPDRVRYEADRMSHLIGELDNEPDILAYDADAHSGYVNPGNSPVIPDCSEDTKRLDWLDAQNKRLNEYHGTTYGWKFDANFQRNAMMLNDSNYPVMSVRQAIDEAIAAAPQQEVR